MGFAEIAVSRIVPLGELAENETFRKADFSLPIRFFDLFCCQGTYQAVPSDRS